MKPTNFEELYQAVQAKQIIAAVRKDGKKDRLFIATNSFLCSFAPRSSRRGYRVYRENFDNYVEFIGPKAALTQDEKLKKQYNDIAKYKRLAQSATFTNSWIEDCKKLPDFETWKNEIVSKEFDRSIEARPKSLYELGITTGTSIDGKVISLSRIAKQYPHAIQQLRRAISNPKEFTHGTILFAGRFAGYDISISTSFENGELKGYLSLEYKGCGNGYYYLLINDENFIGYDID